MNLFEHPTARGVRAARLMLCAVAAVCVPRICDAATIATFADPSTGPQDPLFEITLTAPGGDPVSIQGGWNEMGTQPGLTLVAPLVAMVFTDVSFSMDSVTVNPDRTTGPGTIHFWDDTHPNLFTITFQSGSLLGNFTTFGDTEFMGAADITFSGDVLPPNPPNINEQFVFTFANPAANGNVVTVTAAFDSSAIPEPAVWLLMLGGLALAVWPRRRLAC